MEAVEGETSMSTAANFVEFMEGLALLSTTLASFAASYELVNFL